MSLKITLTALTLALTPFAAVAQCAGDHSVDQAMSCISGTQWDATTSTCTPVATG